VGEAAQDLEPRYASFGEAVEYANIPPGTMRDWIRKGLLPAYRIGPRLLQIDLNDIDKMRRRVRTAKPSRRVRTGLDPQK
jgi:excisionase family DNA binding protein